MPNNQNQVAERFIDEKISDSHWDVGESIESFERLLNHIENTTNFREYFEKAFEDLMLTIKDKKIIIADVGGGVGWTSAIMALHPKVSKVILVEPSTNRRRANKYIVKHFDVPEGKVESVDGTFQNFNLKEKVDIVVLCASIHHCYDDFIPLLFKNIEKCLVSPTGTSKVLIANEHIVTNLWVLRRLGAYVKNVLLGRKDSISFDLMNLRNPRPDDGEHWRKMSEINSIINENGYSHRFYKHKGDLCIKPTPSFLSKSGWIYYYTILDKR